MTKPFSKKPLKKQGLKKRAAKPPLQRKQKIAVENPNTNFRRKLYRFLRDQYLILYPTCEICRCRKGTSLHHKARRRGYNMFRYFMSLCRDCHDWVHSNPERAKELGYLIEARGDIDDWEQALLGSKIIDSSNEPDEEDEDLEDNWI